MSGYWPTSPREHPDYWAADPCPTCEADPCRCDEATDEARDAEFDR